MKQMRFGLMIVITSVLMTACLGMGGGDTAENPTDVAVQPTQAISMTDQGVDIASTSTPIATRDTVQLTQQSQTADDPTQIVETSDSDSATEPTLSPEEYGTQIADLATAQVLPTPIVGEVSAQSITAGNADVTSFYNTQVNYPNTMRLKMELIFRELRMQPTPLSDDVQSAINDDIPTPVLVNDDLIQITPAPARDNQRIESIPIYVIAELDCPANSFDGCEQQQVRRLNLQGINSWNWTIQPLQEISAQYDLSVRLFASDENGNITDSNPLYVEDFVVEVQSNVLASVLQNNAGAFVIAVSIIVLAIVGLIALNRRQRKVKQLGVSAFVSYKRRGSWGIAEKIHDGLTQRGVDTFIDSKDLHEGDFEARLTNEIDNRDYVVVVLVPETLQSEWVVKEIQYALEHGKTVIPILIEGLKMEALNIPPDIADLKKQNAVSLYQKYFEAGMDEILVFLKPLK